MIMIYIYNLLDKICLIDVGDSRQVACTSMRIFQEVLAATSTQWDVYIVVTNSPIKRHTNVGFPLQTSRNCEYTHVKSWSVENQSFHSWDIASTLPEQNFYQKLGAWQSSLVTIATQKVER